MEKRNIINELTHINKELQTSIYVNRRIIRDLEKEIKENEKKRYSGKLKCN